MVKSKIAFWFFLLAPVFFAYQNILVGSSVWGDAPHFYKENFRELIFEPQIWTNRGQLLGGINAFVWIWPVLFIYSLIGKFLSIPSEQLIICFFYLPSILLSLITPIILARYLKLSKRVQFFASLVYVLNTYFLLLIDGGVVGVALAYGIFPLQLFSLLKFARHPNYQNFALTISVTLLITLFDPRISSIAFLVFIILENKKILKSLPQIFFVILTTGLINLYWLLPLINIKQNANSAATSVSLSIFDALTLHQPHWPENIFGQTSHPPIFFLLIPLLIFLGIFLVRKRIYLTFFLSYLIIAVFISSNFYQIVFTRIPFGYAFRDATKMFTPLILISGMLIGLLSEKLNKLFLPFIYIFLIILISPAFFGKLNFVLSKRNHSADFSKIAEHLNNDNSFFRSAWFPETHPLAFATENNPALSAKELVNLRPFAILNTGSYDKFNFLHDKHINDWFDLLGIKYLIFSDNQRIIKKSYEEEKNWLDLLTLISKNKDFTKLNFGQTPVYSNEKILPRIFSVEKLFVVIGSDSIYQNLYSQNPEFIPANQAFVFPEDGVFDSNFLLENISKNSLFLVFNNKTKTDLAMSFAKKYSPSQAKKSQWAIYKSSDYLTWRYQLLIRNFSIDDFDYNLGIALSTQSGEKLSFNLPAEKSGKYLIAIRGLSKSDSNSLKLTFPNFTENFELKNSTSNFRWFTKEIYLDKGRHNFVIENLGGTQVLNAISLIPIEVWEKANFNSEEILNKYQTISLSDLSSATKDLSWSPVKYNQVSSTKYEISSSPFSWIIFTDSYHPMWQIKEKDLSKKSAAAYSMVNVFYKNPDLQEAELVFSGQQELRRGLFFSLVSLLGIAIIILYKYPSKEK